MTGKDVRIGQYWKSKRGVIYRVESERWDSARYVRLVPVSVGAGLRARATWKYDEHVPFDMELVSGSTTS